MSRYPDPAFLSEDLSFMTEVDAALLNRGNRWIYWVSFGCTAFFFFFLIWLVLTPSYEKTRGEGQVVPSQELQPVQSASGGIIKTLFVKENEMVIAGQPLVQIANVKAANEFQALQTKKIDLQLTMRRLEAESQKNVPEYTEEELRLYPGSVQEQLALFKARNDKMLGEQRQAEAELEQKKLEVADAQQKRVQYEQMLLILRNKEEQARELLNRGIFSRVEYLELTQRITLLDGQLNEAALNITRAQSAVSELEERLHNLEPLWQSTVVSEMDKARKELQIVEEMIVKSSDELDQAAITSPFEGIIKRILVQEEGVVRAADLIMEILPVGKGLQIEARFGTQDRSYLEEGKQATINVSAYDPIIYGSLKGRITYISPDTIEDNKGQPWYVVRLNAGETALVHNGKELPIIAGMTVTVDVISGERSLFNYLTKPFFRSKRKTNIIGKKAMIPESHNATQAPATTGSSTIETPVGNDLAPDSLLEADAIGGSPTAVESVPLGTMEPMQQDKKDNPPVSQ